MQFENVIRRRKMVRAYTSDPVLQGAVERIVAAGLAAPSAGNAQGTRLAVVTSDSLRRRIADAAGEPDWIAKGYRPWLGTAPVLIGLGVRIGDYGDRYDSRDKAASTPVRAWDVPYWWFDAGAACEAMLLATVNEGLAAGFLGSHNIPGLALLLEWSDVDPAGVITIGHAADSPPVGSAISEPARQGRVSWHRE